MQQTWQIFSACSIKMSGFACMDRYNKPTSAMLLIFLRWTSCKGLCIFSIYLYNISGHFFVFLWTSFAFKVPVPFVILHMTHCLITRGMPKYDPYLYSRPLKINAKFHVGYLFWQHLQDNIANYIILFITKTQISQIANQKQRCQLAQWLMKESTISHCAGNRVLLCAGTVQN